MGISFVIKAFINKLYAACYWCHDPIEGALCAFLSKLCDLLKQPVKCFMKVNWTNRENAGNFLKKSDCNSCLGSRIKECMKHPGRVRIVFAISNICVMVISKAAPCLQNYMIILKQPGHRLYKCRLDVRNSSNKFKL